MLHILISLRRRAALALLLIALLSPALAPVATEEAATLNVSAGMALGSDTVGVQASWNSGAGR